MKLFFTSFVSLFFAIFILGCGKGETPVQTEKKEEVTNTRCPISFSNGMCAEIKWLKGPTAEEDSSFQLNFWNKEGEKDPVGQVSSYLRMTCCGSVTFLKTEKLSTGKYQVNKVRFMPGNWELYVQLKEGEKVEKQFVEITIKD